MSIESFGATVWDSPTSHPIPLPHTNRTISPVLSNVCTHSILGIDTLSCTAMIVGHGCDTGTVVAVKAMRCELSTVRQRGSG